MALDYDRPLGSRPGAVEAPRGHRRALLRRLLGTPPLAVVAAGAVLACATAAVAPASASADVGYRDFSYAGTTKPTGDKPQSKLWFNDGIWWGSLYNSFTNRYEIFRLDDATQTWSTTGTVIDERRNAGVDAAWSGGRLYVAAAGLSATSSLDSARVRRYSYDSASKTYTLDPGYPVTVSPGGVENVVIDRDSSGTAWVTYTYGQQVYVAHSVGANGAWTTPYVLPVAGADTITADDISAIVAYDGQIGVMWSNQNDWTMYFASHRNGDADDVWTVTKALQQPEWADDHINLKGLDADPSGRVFAATKTSLNRADDPLLLLLVLDSNGDWERHTFGRVVDNHTRAQVVVDREHRQLFMFATSPCCNGGAIYYKQTSLDRINFGTGLGTPFIQSSTDTHISNISTTKQSVTSASGLVGIAGDDDTRTYFHNRLELSSIDSTPPDTVIDTGPDGAANTPSATFTFSATEAGASFDCSLDGVAYQECSPPATYLDLQNGSHTLRVRGVDAADNVDPTPAERSWNVTDTTSAVNLPPVADTYAREAAPNSGSGTATTVQTDGGAGTREEGYFRFNVNGVAHSVESAKLRAYVTNGSGNGPAIYATGGSWTETGLTWNNRPGALGAPSDDKAAVSSGWTTFNVTPLVSGNGVENFVTTQTSTDGTDVNSREYTTRPPRLELKIDPAPETTIDSGPDGATPESVATLGFSSSQSGSTYACSLDGAAFAPCSSPASYTDVADGSHTFRVRATSSATSKTDPTPATRTWSVDTAAPAPPTIELPPAYDTGRSASDAITADSTPHFTGMAEPVGIVSLYDGTTFLGTATADANGRWEFQPESLSDGEHAITATAADVAGNESQSTQALTLIVDTAAPAAPVVTEPQDGALTSDASVSVAGTAEPDARVEVFDDAISKGSVIAAADGRWTVAVSLPDGDRQLSAKATDVAGNTSPPSGERAVSVDTAAPDTAIESGPNNPTSRTTASFALSSSEPGSTFECRLDGAEFAPCDSPASYADVSEGSHTFEARATDAAGNTDASAATWTWTVDAAVPRAPAITAPTDGSHVAETTLSVTGRADAGLTVQLFDGEQTVGTTTAGADGDWQVEAANLADGLHVFTAKATNVGGFTSGPSQPSSVTVDTRAPETSVDSGPGELTTTTEATIEFSSDEAGARFECRIDGAAFSACSSPDHLTGLTDGTHVLEVRAIDRAGNVDASPAGRSWTVDTVAPETSIVAGAPSGIVTSPSATFEFTSSEAGSTFECGLDGSTYTSCSSPHLLSDLGPGVHTFRVRATDRAGNTDATPAERTWTVEAVIFQDGFESGNFSAWSVVETGGDGAAVVQSASVRSGVFAARLSETANTGSFAVARTSFAMQRDLLVSGYFRVDTEGVSGGNVPILRLFDRAGARIVNLRRQNLSGDRVWIEYGGVNTSTPGRLPLGTWRRFELHLKIGGPGADTIESSLDGVQLIRTTTATLGTDGITAVQIGNETKKQAFSLVADDVVIRAH